MGQPRIPPIPKGTSLMGKTVLVTGGNRGLGFELARQFLTLNAARVIITVRSKSDGEEAIKTLQRDLEVQNINSNARNEAFEVDLDDYQSVLRFTQRVKSDVQELDVLLNNAGVVILGYQTSKSGHERTMQVNCYSTFLISLELLPLLQSTAAIRGVPSRLCFVGSGTQLSHSLTKSPIAPQETIIGHFDDKKAYKSTARYADSKLLVNAFVRAIAAKVPASEVLINNACPGLLYGTGLDRNLPVLLKSMVYLWRKSSGRSVTEGAWTLVHATTIMGENTHGKFLQNNKVDIGAPFFNEPAGDLFAQKLWAEIVEEAVNIDPGLSHFVKE